MNVSVLQTSQATVFLHVGTPRSVSSLSLLEGIIFYLSCEKQRILQHGKHVRWKANFLTSSALGGSRTHTGLGFRRVQKVWMQPSLPGGVFIASSFEPGCLLSHIRRGFAAASACELVQGRILQVMVMPPTWGSSTIWPLCFLHLDVAWMGYHLWETLSNFTFLGIDT